MPLNCAPVLLFTLVCESLSRYSPSRPARIPPASVTPPAGSPSLEYRMYLFTAGDAQVNAILSPSLNFMPGRGVRLAVSFDDRPPQIVEAVPKDFVAGDRNREWEESVKNSARTVASTHKIDKPGYHTLKIWMVDPDVPIQKIVVNLGGLKPSYLGPPESHFGTRLHPVMRM